MAGCCWLLLAIAALSSPHSPSVHEYLPQPPQPSAGGAGGGGSAADAAREPPLLLRVPIELDGAPHDFSIRAGESPELAIAAAAAALPTLNDEHVAVLRRTIAQRLYWRGVTWQHKVSVLLLAPTDAPSAPALLAAAASHMVGPAAQLVVVTNGFALCGAARRALAGTLLVPPDAARRDAQAVLEAEEPTGVGEAPWKGWPSAGAAGSSHGNSDDGGGGRVRGVSRLLRRLVFVSFAHEFVGHALAINAALEQAPRHAVVAVVSPSFSLRAARGGGGGGGGGGAASAAAQRMMGDGSGDDGEDGDGGRAGGGSAGDGDDDGDGDGESLESGGHTSDADVFVAFDRLSHQLALNSSSAAGGMLLTAAPPAAGLQPTSLPSSGGAAEGWSRRAPLPLLVTTTHAVFGDEGRGGARPRAEAAAAEGEKGEGEAGGEGEALVGGAGVCVGAVPMDLALQGAVAAWVHGARRRGCAIDTPSLAARFVRPPPPPPPPPPPLAVRCGA
jgi:hypothetical protein